MKSIFISALGLALAAIVFGGCASSQPEEGEPSADRVCVNRRDISAIGAFDDRHVIVKARADDYYLFTVDKGCSGLGFAWGIAIAEESTQVCGDGFSFLSFDRSDVGERRCRIVKIESVQDRKAAEAVIESRSAE